jgi:lipid-A-disaccharide synthase-like uncharacterized protein
LVQAIIRVMQFQVPQFIEVEDKIFGPLTFKQFIYIGGGLGACYLLYRALPIYAAFPFIVAIGGLAAALAFMQLNGRPFILGLESGFFYFVRTKLYLWNNARKKQTKKEVEATLLQKDPTLYVPKLSESKLHELAWSLDIKERIAGGTASAEEKQAQRKAEDVLAPIKTSQAALATKEESLAQQIERLAKERAHTVRVSTQ